MGTAQRAAQRRDPQHAQVPHSHQDDDVRQGLELAPPWHAYSPPKSDQHQARRACPGESPMTYSWRPKPGAEITAREMQILHQLAIGADYQAITRQLGIARGTISAHI